jgi:hypothetical protein
MGPLFVRGVRGTHTHEAKHSNACSTPMTPTQRRATAPDVAAPIPCVARANISTYECKQIVHSLSPQDMKNKRRATMAGRSFSYKKLTTQLRRHASILSTHCNWCARAMSIYERLAAHLSQHYFLSLSAQITSRGAGIPV